jgi:hypothetical protein
MKEHQYRGQLIRVVATETPGTNYWVSRADIRFHDRKGLRFFPLDGPRSKFTTREAAEQDIIEAAKKRIDTMIKL